MSESVDAGDHGEWDALAVGWALSALDPADEERFADHLPGCARCTATVRESLYTVADLAYALPDEAPPPTLKARLMAAVGADAGGAGSAPAAVEQPGAPSVEQPGAPSVEQPGAPSAEYPAEPSVERQVEPPLEAGDGDQPPAEAGDQPWVGTGDRPPAEAGGEQWPLGPPHPGSPGYGVDWFAKPDRTPDPTGIDEPTVVDLHRPSFRQLPPADSPPESDPDRDAAEDDPDRDAAEDDPRAGSAVELPAPRQESPADLPEPSESRDGDAAERGADVVPLAPRRRRLARRLTAGVGVAAVLALIAGLLVSNLRLRDDQDQLRRTVALRDAALQQLTANRPARVAALTADGKPSASRQATLVVRGNQVEIIIETLGATSGNETYWLWTLRCDTPKPQDLKPIRGFTVAQSDFSVRDIGSDPGVATAPCFAISSEEGTATPKAPRTVVAVGQPE